MFLKKIVPALSCAFALYCSVIFAAETATRSDIGSAGEALILLDGESTFDTHPALSHATLYQTPNYVLAVLPREDARQALESGLASREFVPATAPGEWYLVRALQPESFTEKVPHTFFVDGELRLLRMRQDDVAALVGFDGELVRLTSLPRMTPRATPIAQAVGSVVDQVVDAVSDQSWSTYVRELSGDMTFMLDESRERIESRHTQHPDNTLASEYLADRLETLGYAPMFQSFSYAGDRENNVVVEITGTRYPDQVYVLGGHFDSTASGGSNAAAPGADDNASGCAALLEAARVIAGFQFDYTVHLVWFNAEEQGMIGSQEYVKQVERSGQSIAGAIITDMISYHNKDYSLLLEGAVRYRRWMSVAADMAKTYTDLPTTYRYYSFGSDHVSFQSANIPAYLIIEAEWNQNPGYHSINDTFDLMDPHMGVEATRMALATLVTVAGIQAQ